MMKIEKIARVCHEANRAYCATIGDDSQVPWGMAKPWQRDSAIEGVAFVRDHPEAGDAAQHDAWHGSKLAEGWVYGVTKDPTMKTHPCLVPFDELPLEQQLKDRLFRAVALSLLPYPDRLIPYGD